MKSPFSRVTIFLVLAGCFPVETERESLVTGPRILAVRSEPPESKPGESVTYEALVVTPDGEPEDAAMRWAFCAAPKPLTENGSVSTACLGDTVRPIVGISGSVTAATPPDACSLFGPETPPGDFRPRDSDATGGFYQPVRVEAMQRTAFVLERITCNLPNAPLDVAVELAERHVPNRNPKLLPVRAFVNGAPASLGALPASADVRFEVGWSAEDAEVYPAFDPRKQALVDQREALRVSWYATAGPFESDVTGRATDDTETTVSNGWRAPDEPTRVFLWLVLRDGRGGTDFAGYVLDVAPP
ncbi:hypothetical protein [Polyangium jinanense]|uniref:Uncharacterized protein n=1 Tax=Polyangium jinanense TaxID=2829994 RepID=A0A9X4AR46_9BACT|nr:hypothetical protein [Polyangium jinanense]MDC3955427.1 hypothetical protein [Polyangium jinanense]MDC3981728.1 hypothetical protein [Polyangium jinanense]